MKEVPEQVASTSIGVLTPNSSLPWTSNSNKNFRKTPFFPQIAHGCKPITMLLSRRDWQSPHTRSLEPGQSHTRASASTHCATCPLISSGLWLAFKRHKGYILPLHRKESKASALSWNCGYQKEKYMVLPSANLSSAFDTSKLYNPSVILLNQASISSFG